jgi:hypothetical protein
MEFCKIRVALAAATIVLTAACGDSGPSEFDAAGMQADLAVIEQLEGDETFASLNAAFAGITGEFGDGAAVLSAASLQDMALTRGGRASAQSAINAFFTNGGANAISASLVSIPPEVAGKTFVYDDAADDWVASDRTGAPATGVRFVLYAVDAFGAIVSPLVETGYIDLTDLSSGSGAAARLVAVSGGETKADYSASATGDAGNGTMEIAGFVGTGANRLEMDFTADVTTSGDDVTFALDSRLEFPGHDVVFDASLHGASNDVTETYSAQLEELIESPNGRLELAGDLGEGTHLIIRVNGDVYATYDGDSETLTGANGRTLTQDEQGALFASVFALEITVFVPIFLTTPLMWIVGDLPAIF